MQYYQNIKQNKTSFIYLESAIPLKQLYLLVISKTGRRETFCLKNRKGFEQLGKKFESNTTAMICWLYFETGKTKSTNGMAINSDIEKVYRIGEIKAQQ